MERKTNRKQSTRERIKEELNKRLEENHEAGVKRMQEKMDEYQRKLDEQTNEILSKKSEETSDELQNAEMQNTDLPNLTENAVEKKNMEESEMSKKVGKDIFENDSVTDFGAGAVDATKQTEAVKKEETTQDEQSDDLTLPPINGDIADIHVDDEGEAVEKKAKNEAEEKEKKEEKATTGEYEGSLIDDVIKANPNIRGKLEMNSKIKHLLEETVFLKQLITVGDFGRGMTITTNNIAAKGSTPDKVAHIKIDMLKPGRAKSAVVTMPRKLQTILTADNKRTNSADLKRNFMSILDANGNLTNEERQDTVDVVMKYDTLCVRIANLFEGTIAEYGGVDGELDAKINVKSVPVKDVTGATNFADKEVAPITKLLNAQNYVMYKMAQPSSALVGKMGKGEVTNDGDKKVIDRWKSGKVPLKRIATAYSALYTPYNYTSTIKYLTAQPFADGFKDEDAVSLSAKAVWQYRNRDTDSPRMESYDQNMVDADKAMLRVFDPSIDVNTRMDELCMAKGYVKTKADGKPVMKSVKRLNENGKVVTGEDGKAIYDQVPDTAKDTKLPDRTPRDYFTGKPLEGDELRAAQFVRYGKPGVSSKGKSTCPRVQKNRIKFEGLDCVVDASKGIVGTFGIDDTSVSRFVNLVGEEVAKNAFIEAYNTSRTSGKAAVVSEYDDGLLSAILGDDK